MLLLHKRSNRTVEEDICQISNLQCNTLQRSYPKKIQWKSIMQDHTEDEK